MGKLTKLNKDLFNLKNIKEVIKKSVQVVGLTSALFMGGMGLTGCQHDIPYEPEEPTIEQPVEKPSEGQEEKDHCGICEGIQDETHQHDYCNDCEGIQTDPNHTCPVVEKPTPEPGQPVCDDEECLKKGQSMEGHTHDYCPADNCNEKHVHNYCNDDANCLGTDKTSPDHEHDYCNEGDCANITVTDKNHQHDYCDDCEGIQDENHQHDYCNDCEGIQDENHNCTVVEPTLSAEVESIGNGTYSIANFMVNDNAEDSIDQKVADGLECAEKYIKGLTEEFSNDFKTKYASLITSLQNDETYNQDTTSGFDPLINTLKNNCKPIFENMITKVNDTTGLDQCNIIGYYKAFENETYIKALGDYATNDNKIEYKEKATDAKNWADDTYNIAGDEVVFNPEITNKMDTLLSKHSSNIGISTSDLQNLINLSLSISSLDAMHDYSVSKKLSTHTWTCDGGDNTLDDDMINTF